MGESIKLLDQAMLEKLDREQLIERNYFLEKKIIELTNRITELENRLKQNSSNTGKPPSSDGYSKPAPKSQRKKSGKKPGGQHNHKGHGKSMADKVTETIVITPETCPCCGENLKNVTGHKKDTHYVLEMPPIQVEVTECKLRLKKPICTVS